MKKVLLILAVLICPSFLSAAAGEDDYFPLVHDAKYNYMCSYEGKDFSNSIIAKEFVKEESSVFYFVKEKDAQTDNPIIGVNMFGLGSYLKEDNKVCTIGAFWKIDLVDISAEDKQVMFVFPLKTGDKKEVSRPGGEQKIHFTVLEFEDVKVPAGEFKGAAKIMIEDVWLEKNKKYVTYAWLAKDVGLVKLEHSTGRTDVLNFYLLPAKKPVEIKDPAAIGVEQ